MRDHLHSEPRIRQESPCHATPRHNVALAFLLTIPLAAFAQERAATPTHADQPGLTEAQFARLMGRTMGTWRVNLEKSTFFLDPPPQPPVGYIYSPVEGERKGVRFTNADGVSVQYYDGRAYPGQLPGSTISRLPLDEFTVDNVTTRDGKRSARNTQFFSADGKVLAYIGRRVNERGEEIPASFQILEKVPDGTQVFVPKKKP